MFKNKFHLDVKDVQISRQPAKEQLIGRIIHPRPGFANTTPKWEAWFVDGDDNNSVLLLEAWGPHIAFASRTFQEATTYRLSNFLLLAPGRSTPYGAKLCKMQVKADMQVEIVEQSTLTKPIPTTLPLTDLSFIVDLKQSMLLSVVPCIFLLMFQSRNEISAQNKGNEAKPRRT